VRALANDDAEQGQTARDIMCLQCMITPTVLLETEWVLRSIYGWQPRNIAAAFSEIIDLPNINIGPTRIEWAIRCYAKGGDFADMLHICLSENADRFATFDKKIAKYVNPEASIKIEIHH
jgi:predicted nucleic-acid-binding protein